MINVHKNSNTKILYSDKIMFTLFYFLLGFEKHA